jgi:hypothetical protein
VISRTTGTFTGEMTLPDGTVIPPTGKAFDLEFSQTVKWDGDQVTEILAFWDTAGQAQQIGLAYPPGRDRCPDYRGAGGPETLSQWSSSSRMFSTIGYSSSAIFAWLWPSPVRWPAH